VSRLVLVLTLAVACLGAAPGTARAEWILYLSGHLGMSWGTTETSGFSNLVGPSGRYFEGSFSDASPLIAGAVGLTIPLNETTAWELPYDWRLPTWPLRIEADVTGLRRFEGLSSGPTLQSRNFGGTDTWSVVFNVWQGVPLGGMSRMLRKLPGRTPRWVNRALDQMHLYGGAGVGVAGVDIEFTDNTHYASADSTQFAWQAGTGITYSLTKAVAVDLAYRYFDYGDVNARYLGIGTAVDHGPLDVAQTSHEFRGGLRVNLWGFRPWK
jgi:hypothetical protein